MCRNGRSLAGIFEAPSDGRGRSRLKNNGRQDLDSAEGLRRVFCVFAAVFLRHGATALSGGMGRAEHAQSTLQPESLSQVQPTASPVRRQ